MVKLLLSLGTAPSEIHLIGFSLGGHLASYIAKAIPGIGRLTGKYILNITLCFCRKFKETKNI
jgi:dienelactone hydrolase